VRDTPHRDTEVLGESYPAVVHRVSEPGPITGLVVGADARGALPLVDVVTPCGRGADRAHRYTGALRQPHGCERPASKQVVVSFRQDKQEGVGLLTTKEITLDPGEEQGITAELDRLMDGLLGGGPVLASDLIAGVASELRALLTEVVVLQKRLAGLGSKPFLVFAGCTYYPGGGADDLVGGGCDSLEQAMDVLAAHILKDRPDWAHIFNAETGEVVVIYPIDPDNPAYVPSSVILALRAWVERHPRPDENVLSCGDRALSPRAFLAALMGLTPDTHLVHSLLTGALANSPVEEILASFERAGTGETG
jgi:hypothetical protein